MQKRKATDVARHRLPRRVPGVASLTDGARTQGFDHRHVLAAVRRDLHARRVQHPAGRRELRVRNSR